MSLSYAAREHYARQFPAMSAAWAQMSRLQPPRNARAFDDAKPGQHVALSFVGTTTLPMPHLYCDSGKRYDLRRLSGMHVFLAVKRGVDAGAVIRDLFEVAELYPTLVDFETQTVAPIVDAGAGKFKLWHCWPRGGEVWRSHFDA